MGLLEDFFSTLTNYNVKKVITVKSEDDVKNNFVNSAPIYDFFRASKVQGETILDFTSLKGVDDLGNSIRVLAGTSWKDVIKYNPEIYLPFDFSVGGSIYFNESGFGFNEFGDFSSRVEVDAYLNGEKYTGKYKGGIIYSVYIKKENKPFKIMKISGDSKFVISRTKSLLSNSPLPFRDISIVKNEDKTSLVVSYPEIREILVKRYLQGFSTGDQIFFTAKKYKYIYIGKTKLDSLNSDELEKANYAYISLRNNDAFYVILSDIELRVESVFPHLNFNGCIACGNCVEVCPHSSQNNSLMFSPIGFYVLSNKSEENIVANCHMCELCEEVCVADLNIVNALKNKAKLKSVSPSLNINIPQSKSIVITAISESFIKEIFELIKFLSLKGLKLGIITIDEPLDKLIKGDIDKEKMKKILEGVDEIITLTPEESYYLQILKSVKIIEITFAYYLLNNILNESIKNMKIHYPCFYSGSKYSGCSYELLNIINGEGYGNVLPKADISLCPLASKKLGIKSYVDLLGVNIDTTISDKIYSEVLKNLDSLNQIIDDLSWYKEVNPNVFDEVIVRAIMSALEDKEYFDLLFFYMNLNKYSFNEEIKNKVTNIVQGLLFGSGNEDKM
ncbi:4Fe-4S dicluster domain-containing protein [Acidianus manzaensis]|uniref:4Fe-4S ferredoxin-type domain-containing protein n=1 Tax=Acidianus manzaensis TaxID=282676 RepID=A0A1W6JXG0_9CREN|nr:4Fe-4S dicluster domain-containing protein [Acidianus manzaensis]ARM74922.1 hypothetical protein B6F84_02025 [Acidianus manzaensis]